MATQNQRIKFITHKGKTILFVDFSNCKAEQVVETLQEAQEVVRSQPKNSLLLLSDISNAHFNREVTEQLGGYTEHNRPYVKASAVVGIGGIQQVIMTSLIVHKGRFFEMFDDLEKAKDWLALSV